MQSSLSRKWSRTVRPFEGIKGCETKIQDKVTSVPLQKTRIRRNMGRLSRKDMQDGQEEMDTDGFILSV